MTTESSEEGPPSFFKVVRCPSAPHLALPTAFVKRYLEKIPKTPILKTATGESSWRLKIKKIGEDYCFSDGWEKLAKDAQLRIMDIVVVSLIDPFTFEVAFFDANGCDKDLPLNNTKFSGDADDVDEVMSDEEDDGDEVMPNENLCFQKVISEKSHRYTMTLPQKFVKAAELENRSGIRMKDHEGKEWIMGLLVEKYHNRHSLSSGWSLFRQYYNLSEGDICLFKFIKEEGVLSLAQVLKNKKAGKQENGNRKETPANMEGVKRKRGRPRVEKPGNGNGGGVKVKSEDEAEVIKRKRGRPPLQKHRDGGVKIENQSEVVKRKRGRPRVEGKIKIEDGDGDGDGDCDCDGDGSVVKIKVEKGGFSGVEVKTETETEVAAVKRKRGRPPLDRSKQRVIYF
ncbi:putative B3 domain-containing protein REM15 isoform X2 [Cynara cardunculus var. scolymus]|uniref:putative B3 domain-containing protein REM15 isoform X2 n=1 Tax=Cynara cardunculus var. scolymus TaxID=59895 RepID=UPI000D62D946|nr:putative B3 domain-containing protein REM15 isoform X2 [Cynara cardunculus var. scolymus]